MRLGEPVAQFVVGEQGRAAVGVVDDRDLEVRAFRRLAVDQVTSVGDVADHGRSDAAADVALHEGLAELDPEDLRRVDPAVDAGDDVQVQVRDEREPGHALARAGIAGERPVAVQQRGDVRQDSALRGRDALVPWSGAGGTAASGRTAGCGQDPASRASGGRPWYAAR